MTFNEAAKDFSVFTEDVNDAKSYKVTITCEIEVPTDHTQQQTELMTTEVITTLNVIADCGSTTFTDWNLPNESSITINVKDIPLIKAIGPVQDSVSRVR